MKTQRLNPQSRLIVTLFILCFLLLSIRKQQLPSEASEEAENLADDNKSSARRDVIWTARGPATYEEVNLNVFRPNNFRIVEYTYPIPRLDFIAKPSCAKTFEDWLIIANGKIPKDPPRLIEEKDRNAFSMNGYAEINQDNYYNRKAKPGGVVWGIKLLMNSPNLTVGYKEEGLAVHHALKDYPVTNMTGFVIGSEWAWVEVQALRSGAAEILTVEYRETRIVGTEQVKYIHPIKFAGHWSRNIEKYDFAISFSSIEHSGLGRYGDPIDPFGDLREAQKVLCLLKKGGLFYLGVPTGKDSVFYNAHRVYGRMRLAMIMTGFEWLATYKGNNSHSEIRTEDDYNKEPRAHDLYILKKI